MDYLRDILLFEYFFFKPLSYSELTEYLQDNLTATNRMQIDTNTYRDWMIGYYHKALLFCQSQYRRHSDLAWLSFCKHYQVPDYENPSNLDLDYEWADWKENYQLNSHFDKYQVVIQELTQLRDTLLDLKNKSSYRSSDTSDSISDSSVIYREISKIWFNRIINNPLNAVSKLKSISYEKYLETTHWKRVRAAMILINDAVCQAKLCYTVGESWYGGNEADLEIHHLDYSNRGNERFDDLAVLCKMHHEEIHKNLTEIGKPGIEIV